MPKDEIKKTESAPNYRQMIFWLVCLAGLVFGLVIFSQDKSGQNRVDLGQFNKLVLTTDDQHQNGLAGKDGLKDQTMAVFIFSDHQDGRCFWMKGMLMPIDIVWLDDDFKAIKVISNVQPSSYPTKYCSDQNPRYVLEMSSGQLRNLGIVVGSELIGIGTN